MMIYYAATYPTTFFYFNWLSNAKKMNNFFLIKEATDYKHPTSPRNKITLL